MKIRNIIYSTEHWQSFNELSVFTMDKPELEQDLCRCLYLQEGINELARRIVELNDANTEVYHCKNCGVTVWIVANYCPYCGEKL